MILKHINNMIQRMSEDGVWYAEERCYKEKVSTHKEAFLVGFIDACTLIQRYIKQYHLDTKPIKCYTHRKAQK